MQYLLVSLGAQGVSSMLYLHISQCSRRYVSLCVLHWTPKKHEWCARYRERYLPRHFGQFCTLSVIFVAYQKLTATLQQLAYHILSFSHAAAFKALHVWNRIQMYAARLHRLYVGS